MRSMGGVGLKTVNTTQTMKSNLIIGLMLLSTWSSFAQDTSFIFKNTANGVCHVIFIEQKPDVKYYNWIADLNFKTSKNPRLHVELSLLKMANLHQAISNLESEKKKV